MGMDQVIESGFNKTNQHQSIDPNPFCLLSQMLPIKIKIGNIKMGMGIEQLH
jgi:hypothetical protein